MGNIIMFLFFFPGSEQFQSLLTKELKNADEVVSHLPQSRGWKMKR